MSKGVQGFRITDKVGPSLIEGSIWIADSDMDSIWKFTRSGSQITSFRAPSTRPRGIGTDRFGSLWIAIDDGGYIAKMTTSGSVIHKLDTPSFAPHGVELEKENGCIWNADNAGDSIFKLDQAGNIEKSFAAPHYSGINIAEGVGLDAQNSLWVANAGDDSLFKLNQDGSVLASFAAAGDDPTGIDVDSDGCIWNNEHSGTVYQFDTNGSQISSFSAPSNSTSGLGII